MNYHKMTTIPYSKNKDCDALVASDTFEISYHENKVPLFIEDELIRLYFHINSSLEYLKKKFENESISTYIAYKNNSITSIFLVIKNKKRIIVINEMIKIPEEEILRFTNYIFLNIKNIEIISFSLIHRQSYQIPFPSQQFDSSEDLVLALPSTPAIYLQSLSVKTRRNIRYQLKKIIRDYPDFQHQTYECSQIREHHINDLIDLNKNRIAEKNGKYGINNEEIHRIFQLAKTCGLVLIVKINGKTCGGAINFRLGNSYFGHTIAHDSHFNAYGLGILSAYLMICENIMRGGKNAHMSWGRYEYKYKLSGVPTEMARLSIYRSKTSFVLDFFTLLKNKITTILKKSRSAILESEHKTGPSKKYMSKIINVLRKLKRGLSSYRFEN